MPDKPLWYGNLDNVIRELGALEWPWVDRETLEKVLGVGRRRAQQILQPCVTRQIGRNGVADREILIAHLRSLAAGDTAVYEKRRRQRLAQAIEESRRSAMAQPRVLVEAPTTMAAQEIADLPQGVRIARGEISIAFESPAEALQRLLALAMAIGNNFSEFERLAGG